MSPVPIQNAEAVMCASSFWLREGAKFIGPHPWHSDGGAKSFSERKNDGANTFPGEKNDGAETF